MSDAEVIQQFRDLYSGALAQKRRDAGEANAMPPWAETYWLGKQVAKSPLDLWVYQEILVETRPDLLIETGTSGGGSAFFFATIFDLVGCGHIVTVDKDRYPALWREHPRITYLAGDSVSAEIVQEIACRAKGKRTMLSMDSLHTFEHVSAELSAYAPLVSPGCYLVVEDVCVHDHNEEDPEWAGCAVRAFASQHSEFQFDRARERHLMTSNAWLRRTQ